MTYPVAPNEEERLRALHELQILDSAPDAATSAICAEAARAFGVPVALVSLVDRDRQWFKARVGLDLCETARDVAFCNHAILQDRPLVVPDATLDPRFADNPLVLGPPGIRFYAGAPLFFGGSIRLGTLCLIDFRPRSFTPEEVHKLEKFANRVIACLWSHDMSVNAHCYGALGDEERRTVEVPS